MDVNDEILAPQDCSREEGEGKSCEKCAYGSPHQKSFRFIAVNKEVEPLRRRRARDHGHVTVEGEVTKASASYTDGLASALATCIKEAVLARNRALAKDDCVKTAGNIVATSSCWKKVDAWSFRVPRHINILEMKSLCRLADRLATSTRSVRVVNLVGSNVVRCAASKGRSSSVALAPFVRSFGATCVCTSPCLLYLLTRLNTADDPTTDRDVREAWRSCCISELSEADCRVLCAIPKLRRWASNWVKLVLGLRGFQSFDFMKSSWRNHGFPWPSASISCERKAVSHLWILIRPLACLAKALLAFLFPLWRCIPFDPLSLAVRLSFLLVRRFRAVPWYDHAAHSG